MYCIVPRLARAICVPLIFAHVCGSAAAFDLFGLKLFDRSDNVEISEDALPYQTTFAVTGGGSGLERTLKNGSLLVQRQSEPPTATVGLVARAREDRRNLVGLLFKEGYYAGVVSIRIDGTPLDRISVSQTIVPPAEVTIEIVPGELFRFGTIVISGAGPVDYQSMAFRNDLIAGEIAHSEAILKTESAILKALEDEGYPFPRIVKRDIVADHRRNALDVNVTVARGRSATFGAVSVEGAERMNPGHIAMIADIPAGTPYSAEILRHAKSRLAKIEALASVSLRPVEPIASGGSVPIVIKVTERKQRVIGVSANWSSTDGVNAEAYWKHRNLFGYGELFRVGAGIGRLDANSDTDNVDANFSLLFSQPGYFGPATRFDNSFEVLQEHPDAYRRRAVIGQTGIAYQYSPVLELTGSIQAEYSEVSDAQGTNEYGMLSLPLTADYDSRSNRLDPADGIHATALVEPTADVLNGSTYLKLDSSLASYYALDRKDRFILAGRIAAGVIFGADSIDIPADRRFLAGGGGSVRGYAYKNIGDGRLMGEAVAGRSRLEGSAEFRAKFTETIGAAIFADAAVVDSDPGFSDPGDFKVGVGGGLRYFTPVGPIRLDVAVPLDPDKDDPDFAFYLGLGQAF